MRLLRESALQRLEARAGSWSRAAAGIGIVWTRDESRVERELDPGEWIAVDMYRVLSVGRNGDQTWCVRVVERVTRDEWDLGWVYDAAGAVIGRVTESDGSMLTWRPEPAAAAEPASVPEAAAPLGGAGAIAPD